MTDTVRTGLLAAFRFLMRPLIRILIRNGISHGEFAEYLKLVFVDVAEVDFALPDRDTSQSRVAILTGLSRKEVALQKEILEGRTLPSHHGNLHRVTRVLQGWHTDADFTGPYGMPLELVMESSDKINFRELMRRYCPDMAPLAMADELLRVGVMEQTASGEFKVLTRAYVPESLHPDALERLGTVVRNFLNTVEYNMEREASAVSRFERVVVADNGLPEDLLGAFDSLLRLKGQQLLVELDNWLSSQESENVSKDPDRRMLKTGVGIYHYIDED